MTEFIAGQRWLNDAQPQKGLGTVLRADARSVTLVFPATDETMVYAKQSVPLTRVRFAPGEQIVTAQKQVLEVTATQSCAGLLIYTGVDANGVEHTLSEAQLDNRMQMQRPSARLFHGQIDPPHWFEVRCQTWQQVSQWAQNPLRGLTTGRVSLIPHQLYIAHEVANRYAPRVLLADEVGLGKTIEAGMILHHQWITERAKRILIVVPESLVHQWWVEMLRRFNLAFAIFDQSRYEAGLMRDGSDTVPNAPNAPDAPNPFLAQPLVLCSLGCLRAADFLRDCQAAEWDLLVVDEAHHLQWSPQSASAEYQHIETLAAVTKGVLLLTATPEQLGRQSHFARLRLLDAARFSDYAAFLQEQADYAPLAELVQGLLDNQPLADLCTAARAWLDQASLEQLQTERLDAPARLRLAEKLLDHHGSSRVLFRNTRRTVKGFPQRVVHTYPLDLPEEYRAVLAALRPQAVTDMQQLLSLEQLSGAPNWTRFDPRLVQLRQILRDVYPAKVLVLAASVDTVLALGEALRQQGIQAAVFHQRLSLLARDRAAAWFADSDGVQSMLCSEIGSEGRNFQFAQHLVLFDLPLNPDLLEQRIGRLDRIGQAASIQIHLPYLLQSAAAVMVQWYQQGLNALAQPCPAAPQVFSRLRTKLEAVLLRATPNQSAADARASKALVQECARLNRELNQALQAGYDRLLEFNSCPRARAEALYQQALALEQPNNLQVYLEGVFDCLGVEYDVQSENCYALNVGTDMLASLPQLPPQGLTVTYTRQTALAREDVHYLTWDHPLVTACMDLMLSSELGNTAVVARPVRGVARGCLLLESIYVLEPASSAEQPSEHYLPPTIIRVCIDQTGQPVEHLEELQDARRQTSVLKPELSRRIVAAKATLLSEMLGASDVVANQQAPAIIAAAQQRVAQTIRAEAQRLQQLSKINPNVRQQEIDFFITQAEVLEAQLEATKPRLDALRVLVAT